MKHHDKNQVGEEKGLFGLCFYIAVHHQRKLGWEFKQDRNLKVGADADVMEEHYKLVHFPWLVQPAFL